jgi:hypothetical protein
MRSPLHHTFVAGDHIGARNITAFLSDNITNDNDIIVGYDHATMFDTGTHTWPP